MDGTLIFTIGKQESASWNPGTSSTSPSVTYTYQEKRVIITLQCSTTGAEEFEVFGEDPTNVYRFRLTHKCACWDGCSSE